jgi:6-phosphofructokinase 1
MKGACVILQSGGPTCVINASLYGVIKQAQQEENITNVYGSLNGIEGLINDNLIDLDLEVSEEIEYLKTTPSAILGSSRYKLPKSFNDETYGKIFNVFKKHNIRYFFLIGGNDSMDTANKMAQYFADSDYECNIMGVPKTVDNDLIVTDHTPGYGSAIKYVANVCSEIAIDVECYKTGKVTIIEIMGRDAGWLTAGSKLASLTGHGPDLIYVPEVRFDVEDFLSKVKEIYDRKHNAIVCISEGIRDENGNYILNTLGKETTSDTFGHAYLGGVAAALANEVSKRLNLPTRGIELNTPQRCASHIASLTDINEAIYCGKEAVKRAVLGLTGHMIIMNRVSSNPYEISFESKDLHEIANQVKYFPVEWVKGDCDITDDFINYALPLISGEPCYEFINGLSRFTKLAKHKVK